MSRQNVLRVSASIFVAFAVLATCFGRFPGLGGALVGAAVALFSVLTLGLLSRTLLRTGLDAPSGSRLTVLVLLLKLPALLIGVYVGLSLRSPGPGCFLAGLGLVYCATVWFLASPQSA